MAWEDIGELGDLVAGGQIRGAREAQEDSFRTSVVVGDSDGCVLLMVLADGMGGYRGGAEASRLAVAAYVDAFADPTGGIRGRLRAALDAANIAVGGYAAADARYSQMGCTLVACVVTEDAFAHWISVGDSPLWCARADGGAMERLNADHSMRPVLRKLVQHGHMSAGEAEGESARSLRSAVTGGRLTLVDEGAAPVRLEVGDRVVLASDGMETLPERDVCRLSGQHCSATQIVSDLLAAVDARASREQDNATVVLYRHIVAGGLRSGFEALARHQELGRK